MKLELNQSVNAPAEVVFAVATDLDRWAENIGGITKIERLTEGPVGVGTRFRETRVMFKKEATEEMEFTAFEPNRRYQLSAESCGCSYVTDFRFVPSDAGTRVEMEMNTKPLTFFAKLMSPLGKLMAGTMKKCVMDDLSDLAKVAESRADGTS